jgi:hypothetical protein
MVLSAEKFEIILASLRSDAVCGRNQEKRNNPRVGVRMHVNIAFRRADDVMTTCTMRVRDISLKGIGLLGSTEIPEGTFFAIQLSGRAERVAVVYRVVRCQPIGSDMFQVGASFEQYIGSEAKN